MKTFFRLFILVCIIFVGFYLWASSSVLDPLEKPNSIYQISSGAEEQDDTLSVMTFNIGYLSGMTNNKSVERTSSLFDTHADALLKCLKSSAVDILAMQEIDFASARSYDVDQLDLIAKQGGFNYAAKALNWDKRYVPFPYWPFKHHFGKVKSGQAIVSKFKIHNHTINTLPKPLDQPFYYNDFYLDRLVQTIVIHVNKKPLTIMNVHLEAFSKKTRSIQLRYVFEKFKRSAITTPTILLGDFNEPFFPEENSYMSPFYNSSIIGQAISPQELQAYPEKHFTYSAETPKAKIDYIFYSKAHIEMFSAETITATQLLSDHLPVLMRFKLK